MEETTIFWIDIGWRSYIHDERPQSVNPVLRMITKHQPDSPKPLYKYTYSSSHKRVSVSQRYFLRWLVGKIRFSIPIGYIYIYIYTELDHKASIQSNNIYEPHAGASLTALILEMIGEKIAFSIPIRLRSYIYYERPQIQPYGWSQSTDPIHKKLMYNFNIYLTQAHLLAKEAIHVYTMHDHKVPIPCYRWSQNTLTPKNVI